MIKNNKHKFIISCVLILLPIVVGLLLWNDLPARMTTHWGGDGVADGTGVGADDLAAGVDEFALGVGLSGVAFQKAHIIPVGDKADILGIPLFGVEEALLCGDGPDVLLAFKFAQGEAGVGQLFLGQKIQDVALILGQVPCLFQQPPAPLLAPFDPGVVARDDGLTA